MSTNLLNNQKADTAVGYLLLALWPFGAALLALKNYRNFFSKGILIGVFVFMGMTALPEGDLEFYQSYFYENANLSLEAAWNNLIDLKESKFYISFFTFIFAIFTSTHIFYLGFLYAIFGYYLISYIELVLKDYEDKKADFPLTKLLVISFILLFSLRNSLNLAFYTGAIFFIYHTACYLKTSNKQYLILMLLSPFFHFALVALAFPVLLYQLLKNRIWICAAIAILTLFVGRTSVVESLGRFAGENKGTLVDEKYRAYASERGARRLELNYEQGAKNSNWKLKAVNQAREIIFDFAIIFGIALLLFKKNAELSVSQRNNLSFVLLLISLSNLTLNVSNGSRFQIFFVLFGVQLFLDVIYKTKYSKLFRVYLVILTPILAAFGIMSLYASNQFLSSYFFFSNFLFVMFFPPS